MCEILKIDTNDSSQYAGIVMPKSLDTVINNKVTEKVWYSRKNKHQRVLKSKENIFKPKCNRELKKKLKKYKLRRDGIEDPDILDVSKTLVEFLRIKSPSNHEKSSVKELTEGEGINSGNYLMRMVRRKKTCHEIEECTINGMVKNEESVVSILQDEINDPKNMDAFKVMMDARNKSIGSNSPGKEKIEVPESQELIDRKVNRAKRVLTLQKLAVSKGSLKNKELEEQRDSRVQKKMVKRAQRLKDMISGTDTKVERKINNNCADKVSLTNNFNDVSVKPINNSLKLCNLFDNAIEVIDHTNKSKNIPIEDIEFLKKLSPSIKKKENMLSYFNKVLKDNFESDKTNCSDKINDKSVIKVKFSAKHKKKSKKITQAAESLHISPETADANNATNFISTKPLNNYSRCKRKHLNIEEGKLGMSSLETSDFVNLVSENRPKRNVKKPIKYSEDMQIFSSDEEFHIFTPKKKRNEKSLRSTTVEDKKKKEINNGADILELTSKHERRQVKCKKELVLSKKKEVNNHSSKSIKQTKKKDVKLAPIFLAKMHFSASDIEAKQNFLKSGVPEKLKKKVPETASVVNYDIFPSVVHIQQNQFDVNSYQYKTKDWCNILNYEHFNGIQNKYLYKDLLTLTDDDIVITPAFKMLKPEQILRSLKNSYPKFPVYRTYNLLQGKSRGEFSDCSYQELDNSIEIVNGCIDTNNEGPDQLNWCDKYKPTSSKQIIGNFESVKELKRWLESWTENLSKAKQLTSDSSDFSDFYNSDTDSRDTVKNSNNVLIMTGQTGSGKTSSVYAVASELAIKVIEVNASSKRTGKIMLQDLQEATQSHKVDRGKSGSESSQKHQEEEKSLKTKKHARPKTVHNAEKHKRVKLKKSNQESSITCQTQAPLSQESGRTGMSLILVDDADIIFEQDDGFCSAISQLVQSSKRPVILITSTLSCPHLQRFLHNGKVLHMHPYLPRMLGTWLDIMCLTDVGNCCKGLGAKILEFFKGDIRKTINCLQFYMISLKHTGQDNDEDTQVKYIIEDEDSSISWAYQESESSEKLISEDSPTEYYIDKYMQILHFDSSVDIFNVWWNLNNHYNDCNINDERGINIHIIKEKNTTEINKISQVLDTLSMIDYFDYNHYEDTNITTSPWHTSESASLLENENFDYYNKSSSVAKEIADTLLVNTAVLNFNKYENRFTYEPPSLSIQRNRNRVVARHNKLSNYLNPSSVLDHRAIALDYWSACRSICRTEKNKTDSIIKRNNRFCHYLKSLNILCKNEFFDSLADSLS